MNSYAATASQGQENAQSRLPIRIAFVITELDPGGAERALTQLVLHLDRSEWVPFVISLGVRGHFADVLEAAGITVICLNSTGISSLPRVLYRLTRELRRLKPAIVQTFLFHANILGRIAAKLAGIRIVVSGLRVAERRHSWHGKWDRLTNRLVATNVCVSQGVAEFSRQVVGLDPAKLVVIPNSVDFERFANATPADLTQLGIPSGSKVFLSVGRLDRQKGFDVLIEAIAQPNPLPQDVHFLIVGDGPEYHNVREQIHQRNLSNIVHMVGRRDDVPQIMAACTALILPSRWEGMPNVVLEAMAAGLPVIATRVEGIPELVKDGVTGMIVPAEHPVELQAAIHQLISNPRWMIAARHLSQSIVFKEFTPHATTRAYTKLYQQLLKCPSK